MPEIPRSRKTINCGLVVNSFHQASFNTGSSLFSLPRAVKLVDYDSNSLNILDNIQLRFSGKPRFVHLAVPPFRNVHDYEKLFRLRKPINLAINTVKKK
jgi:hypothetical protein